MSNRHYTLVCFRQDGEETCRGCLMARSSAAFDMFESSDLAEVAAKDGALRFEDSERDREYCNWDTYLLIDGRTPDFGRYMEGSPDDPVREEFQRLSNAALAEAISADKQKKADKAAKEKADAAEEAEKRAIATEERERETYKRLSEKYGATP